MFATNVLKLLAIPKTTQAKLIRNAINISTSQMKSIFQISTTRYNASNIKDTQSEVNPDPSLRLVRQMYPEPTKFCLIPETFFTFFHNKTGVTGFYTLIITFGTYLFSKEIMVMEHEFYNGLSMAIMNWGGVKYVGPGLAKYLDKEIDLYEKDWNEGRVNSVSNLNKQIENEQQLQWSTEGQLLLCEAKHENVLLQLEYEFRKRLTMVHQRMKHRLDFQVALVNIENKFQQKNMVEWVVDQVLKAWTNERDAKNFDDNLQNLQDIAQAQNKKK